MGFLFVNLHLRKIRYSLSLLECVEVGCLSGSPVLKMNSVTLSQKDLVGLALKARGRCIATFRRFIRERIEIYPHPPSLTTVKLDMRWVIHVSKNAIRAAAQRR
jgi:hypothetical protein